MYFTDLKDAVSFTAYGSPDIDRTLLVTSTNAALKELYLRIPIIKRESFCVRSPKPAVYYPRIDVANGETSKIPILGKAYSMKIVGRGTYAIKDGTSISVYQFNTGAEGKIVKGFISYGGSIDFWGSFSVSIFDFALYDEMFNSEVDSIPVFSPTVVYSIKELYSDFQSLISPVTDKYGNEIKGCSVYDGQMEICSDYDGEVIITYRRLPAQISQSDSEGDDEKTVDIPAEYEELLIWLTAYNYWRSVDEANAKICKEQFDILISSIENHHLCINQSYRDVNGWA